MPRYGSGSVFYLVGGRSLLGVNPKSLSSKITALHENATGLGDTIVKSLPTGVFQTMLQHGGAFFDTTSLHAVLSDVADSVQETADVVCLGYGGDTIGQPFIGFEGVYKGEYETQCEIGRLTKANTRFLFNGAYDDGVILHPLTARTQDTNHTSVDQLASSSAGAVGYLQVTAFSGFSQAVIKIQDSSDDSNWDDLITFTTVTSAPTAERLTVSGTVNRYVRAIVDVTGSGSVTFFVGINRG